MLGAGAERLLSKFFELTLFTLIAVSLLLFYPQILILLLQVRPCLLPCYFSIWAAGVLLDAYSTWRFYRKDPEKFTLKEASLVMKFYYRRMGFIRAAAATVATMDGAAIALLTLILMPEVSKMLNAPAGPLQHFASSAAFVGTVHLIAAIYNFLVEAAVGRGSSRDFKGRAAHSLGG
jgi:hypothetical protein